MNAKSKFDIEWDEKKKKEIKYEKIKGSNEIKEMERKDKEIWVLFNPHQRIYRSDIINEWNNE